MTSFTCPICYRQYSTDATRPSIVKMMRANAAMCEQQCRKLVEARFGPQSSNTALANLYSRLTQESPR